jgi:hydrogenase maturation factor
LYPGLTSSDSLLVCKMCITRVGKVIAVSGSRATIRLLDQELTCDVDVSMIPDIQKNRYLEVFADTALRVLTPKEASWRRRLWAELRQRNGGKGTK